MNDIENKIKAVIDNVRPYLISDGGNIEFVKYEDNTVYVKLQGACADCYMQDSTLKDGVEEIIKSEINEDIQVVNIM